MVHIFKCDPILIRSLRGEPEIFPAYHMNKARRLTVALNDSVLDELIQMLPDMSYGATASKKLKGHGYNNIFKRERQNVICEGVKLAL